MSGKNSLQTTKTRYQYQYRFVFSHKQLQRIPNAVAFVNVTKFYIGIAIVLVVCNEFFRTLYGNSLDFYFNCNWQSSCETKLPRLATFIYTYRICVYLYKSMECLSMRESSKLLHASFRYFIRKPCSMQCTIKNQWFFQLSGRRIFCMLAYSHRM